MHSLFASHLGSDEQYVATYFSVVIREFGYPSEVALDTALNPAKFTEMGFGPNDLEPPFATFRYRVRFAHEGPGVILIRTILQDGACKIGKVVFGLPRAREDALRRHYEIGQQINAEFAATLGQ